MKAEAEKAIVGRIRADRLQKLTLDMTAIRSYTGDTREVAEFYAAHLEEMGLAVTVVRDYPNSPCVVGRLAGAGGGPALELNGHMDTVPVEHVAPYVADGRIYGRGSADMKGGIAAMTEAVRVIKESGVRLKGDLLLVTHGLHEAPAGHSEDLVSLLKNGIKGDAALISEVAHDTLPIAGMGVTVFDVTFSRPGQPTHELHAEPGTPHPIWASHRFLDLIKKRQAELDQVDVPYIGHESLFVGVAEGGDFYNRWPTTSHVVGTRRYAPGKTYADMKVEMEAMVRQVEEETGASAELTLHEVKDGFRVDEKEPLIGVLQGVYSDTTGKDLPLVGIRMVGDAPMFLRHGGISALYHGPAGEGAHADLESVPVAELVRVAQVYALAALRYVGFEK